MAEKEVKFSELAHFTPKQMIATTAAYGHQYTLFGGAAGPGKSYWLRWFCVLQLIKWGMVHNLRGIHGALFSEDYPTLKDRQISKMEVEFPKWLGEIKDSKTEGLAFHIHPKFGGHVLMLRNLDDPSKYLSSEFAIIAVEELTMNEEEKFHKLRGRMRWTGVPEPKFIAATNPGQIGHEWVKKRWIDKDFPKEELGIAHKFAYVPALPTDNPHLAESYIETLGSLPEKLRKAYLEGNWDSFEGQFFSEWDRDIHVVDPFTIPESWVKLRSIDPSGRAGTTACGWYTIDESGNVFKYREYYVSGLDVDEHAREIARLSEGEQYPYTCIDAAAFAKLGLPETTAEIYERNGVIGLVPSMKARVMGWNTFHQYLRHETLDPITRIVSKHAPKLKFFKNCLNTIRTIPLAIHDEKEPQDIKSEYVGAEHGDALDETRYLLQTLREQKSRPEKSFIEKRIEEIRKQDRLKSMSFNYRRS